MLMFRYKILKQDQFREFITETPIFETDNEDEIIKYISREKLQEIKEEIINSIHQRKKLIEDESDYAFVFANTIYRHYIDENTLLEIKYKPVEEVLEEIEKETGKAIKDKLKKNAKKIYYSCQNDRLILKARDTEKKKLKSIINVRRSRKLEELFKVLRELWNGG